MIVNVGIGVVTANLAGRDPVPPISSEWSPPTPQPTTAATGTPPAPAAPSDAPVVPAPTPQGAAPATPVGRRSEVVATNARQARRHA